jgi:hypothetical protein
MFALALSAGLATAMAAPRLSNEITMPQPAALSKRDCNADTFRLDKEALGGINYAVGNAVSIPMDFTTTPNTLPTTACVSITRSLLETVLNPENISGSPNPAPDIQTNIELCGPDTPPMPFSQFYKLLNQTSCPTGIFATDGTYVITLSE